MTDANRDLFRDAYRYYEKYEATPFEPDDFASAAGEMDEYQKKHGSTLLAKDLFSAIYTHFGNRWKEERKKEEERAEQTEFQMVPEAEGAGASDTV